MQADSTAIVVHGGAGAGSELSDGCRLAAQAAAQSLALGEPALSAAVAAVLVLENDERYNAGTGAALRLDGRSIEMDAAVMDTRGTLGAVAALRAVKNPVLVALDVAQSPHVLLAGEGAQRYARSRGHAAYDVVPDRSRRAYQHLLQKMATCEQPMAGVDNIAFARHWNGEGPPPFQAPTGCDTVGAVVRDADGHFAVACSTGGSAPSLLGRVGDTPLIGCGFYAGADGAVAASGIGEYLIRTMLAATVYRWIADGVDLHEALRRGIALIRPDAATALIAVSKTQAGFLANAPTPSAQTVRPV